MATVTPRRNLDDSHRRVRHPLQKLRGYIRSYVSAEGAATLLLFVALWFWVALLLDYEAFNLFHLDWVKEVPTFVRTLVLGGLFTLLALVGLGMALDTGVKRKDGGWLGATVVGWLCVAAGALTGAVVRVIVSAWLGGPSDLISVFLLSVAGLVLVAGLMVVTFSVLLGLTKKSVPTPWYFFVVLPVLALYLAGWVATGVLAGNRGLGGGAAAMLVIALLLGPIVVMVVKRLVVDFRDNALALVLERRYPKELGDRLITAVELANAQEFARYGYSTAMIEQTIHDAADRVEPLPVQQVFDWGRLVRLGLLVALVTVGIYLLAGIGFCIPPSVQSRSVSAAGFGRLNQTIGIWTERNLLLRNTPWPREAHLEYVGFPSSGEMRIPQNTQPDAVVVRAYKWVIADKDSPDGWRPLRWGDLTANLLGAEAPADAVPADWRPAGGAAALRIDDIELRLEQPETHATLAADSQKALRDVLAMLEERAGRSDMSRMLRMLKVPEQVVGKYAGKDTRGDVPASREPGRLYQVRLPVLKESVELYVRGEDFYTPPVQITTVPPPTLTDLWRDEYQPAYLVYRLARNEDAVQVLKGRKQVFKNRGVSRLGSETSRIEVPSGTDVVLHGKTDKPLKGVAVRAREGSMRFEAKPELVADADGNYLGFRVRFDNVHPAKDRAPGKPAVLDFDVAFTDTDNVTSTRNVVIKPNEDTLPTASLEIAGVRQTPKGHYLITPRAYLPFAGKMEDLQGLDRVGYAFTLAALEDKRDEEGGRMLLVLGGFGGDPLRALVAAGMAFGSAKQRGADAGMDVRRLPLASFEQEMARRRADLVAVPEIQHRLKETIEQTAQRWLDETIDQAAQRRKEQEPGLEMAEILRQLREKPPLELADIIAKLRDQPPQRPLLKGYDLKADEGGTPFDLKQLGDGRLEGAEAPGAQQRFELKVWVEVMDNDIENGPNRGRSKDTFVFHVIPEEDLRLEIFKDEEALRVRMQEIYERLRGPGSVEDKLVKLVGDLADPKLMPDGFGPGIARAGELRAIVEKCLDETNKIHLDYTRILRELELNRVQESKIEQVKTRIVGPIGRLISGFPSDPANMAKREVGYPATSRSLQTLGQNMDAAQRAQREAPKPANAAQAVEQARKDVAEARELVKDLADRVEAILKDMEQITQFGDALERARRLLQGVTDQQLAFNRWKKWLEDDLINRLLKEPGKP